MRSYKPNLDISASITQGIPSTPSWAMWKSRTQYEATIHGQQSSLQVLQNIAEVERAVVEELQVLDGNNIYPTQELSIIRKEVKAFKESKETYLLSSV